VESQQKQRSIKYSHAQIFIHSHFSFSLSHLSLASHCSSSLSRTYEHSGGGAAAGAAAPPPEIKNSLFFLKKNLFLKSFFV
jgi:hypothetical protein